MNKRKTITFGILLAALSLSLAPSAAAQGFFGVSFEKHKRGKHFSFNLGIPFGDGYRRRVPVYEPAPIPRPVHVHGDCCRRVIPGHYEVVRERIRVPRYRTVWVPPVYRVRDGCDVRRRPVRVMVRQGYHKRVFRGYRWKKVKRRVWVPERYELVCGH